MVRKKKGNGCLISVGVVVGFGLFLTFLDDIEFQVRSVMKWDPTYERLFPDKPGRLSIRYGWNNFFNVGHYMVVTDDQPIEVNSNWEVPVDLDWQRARAVNSRELEFPLLSEGQAGWTGQFEMFKTCPLLQQKVKSVIYHAVPDDPEDGDDRQTVISNPERTVFCLIDSNG